MRNRVADSSWAPAGLIAAGVIFYCYYAIYKMAAVGFDIVGFDFLHGRIAMENFLAGRPIYTPVPGPLCPATYLPLVSSVFLPFCRLPPDEARVLWFVLGHILILFTLWNIYKYGRGKNRLHSAAAAAAALLFSMPLYSMLQTGNINILIFTGLGLIYAFILSGKWTPVAFFVAGFAAIKIFPAFLMAVFVKKKDWRACLNFLFFVILIALVSLIAFGPENNIAFVRGLPGMKHYVDTLYTTSLVFFLRLFWPGMPGALLYSADLVFMLLLLVVWMKTSGSYAGTVQDRAVAVVDFFAVTVILLLIMPSAWISYTALLIFPFYFVIFTLLGGEHKLRYAGVFIGLFILLSFWEIYYYHLPVTSHGVTIRGVESARSSYPVLYPLLFSLHFILNLAFFGWISINYKELCEAVKPLAGSSDRSPQIG